LLHIVAIRGTVCNNNVTKRTANGDDMLRKNLCYIASPFAVRYVTIFTYRLVVTYRASSSLCDRDVVSLRSTLWLLICANLQFVVFSLCRGEKTIKRQGDKTIIIALSPRKDDKTKSRQCDKIRAKRRQTQPAT
jgi:hypothetical protein